MITLRGPIRVVTLSGGTTLWCEHGEDGESERTRALNIRGWEKTFRLSLGPGAESKDGKPYMKEESVCGSKKTCSAKISGKGAIASVGRLDAIWEGSSIMSSEKPVRLCVPETKDACRREKRKITALAE